MAGLDPASIEFLLQRDLIDEQLPRVGTGQWQPLYSDADHAPHRFGLWCALLDEPAAEPHLNATAGIST